MSRYACLVLDHDDTAVQSTVSINYPSFVETLELLRPQIHYTCEEFVSLCADPGFEPLCMDILGFSPEEMRTEEELWLRWVRAMAPDFWPGIPEIVARQKAEGGLVCVVSHSFEENIRRDYALHCPGVELDGIYGWELGADQRKPHPWPLLDIMDRWSLKPGDLLMVDDLKPGYTMAKAAGVDFVCAHWGQDFAGVHQVMDGLDCMHMDRVEQLAELLFG